MLDGAYHGFQRKDWVSPMRKIVTKLLVAATAALLVMGIETAGAEPVTLTTDEAISTLSGLRALDGFQDETKKGDLIVRPYDIDEKIREDIAHDENALQPIVTAHEKARQQSICAAVPETCDLAGNGAAIAKFRVGEDKALSAAHTVDLVPIKAADLKLGTNKITGSALSLLALKVCPDCATKGSAAALPTDKK